MDNHYTIYVKKDCGYCVRARDELFRQSVNHTIFVMDEYPEELQAIKDFHEHPTVPIIFLNMAGMPKLIGGYSDLKKHFDKK